MNRFVNFLMFYLGWFACVVGAGRGALWAGPATAAVLLLAISRWLPIESAKAC